MASTQPGTAPKGGKPPAKDAKQAPPPKDQNQKSGKDLKAAKKAEKAARRAQGKEETGKPQGAQRKADTGPSGPQDAAKKKTPAKEPVKAKPTTKAVDNPLKSFYGHLDGRTPKSSISGASRDVHPAIVALGLQMSNFVICGSNARCVAMLLAFKKVIRSYSTPAGTALARDLVSHLSPQIEWLKACRPLSVSMGNAIRWLKSEIPKIDIDLSDVAAINLLCDMIDDFINERIVAAGQVIASRSEDKIRNGDVIVTFAKSSIVQTVLMQAKAQGKSFRVVILDSGPLFEGRNLASHLESSGLDVQYESFSGLYYHMKEATKVFLGAHAMLGNGNLKSRAGTAQVALAAKELNVPVIVCCESVKFTEKISLNSLEDNELVIADPPAPSEDAKPADLKTLHSLMYDVTPAELISLVLTEDGSVPPSSVSVVHSLRNDTGQA